MTKNEVNNKRRVQQLRAGGSEDLKEFYTHYRDTCYGSGSVSLTWAREASELILTLLEERESFKDRARSSGPKIVLRLMKNGHIWDYTKHVEDVTAWSRKILAEEPDARIEVEYASEEEMYQSKTGGL
jgi:hypothetical protein